MFINTDVELFSTVAGCEVKQALTESGDQDFKYLGSWCDKSRDMQTRLESPEQDGQDLEERIAKISETPVLQSRC